MRRAFVGCNPEEVPVQADSQRSPFLGGVSVIARLGRDRSPRDNHGYACWVSRLSCVELVARRHPGNGRADPEMDRTDDRQRRGVARPDRSWQPDVTILVDGRASVAGPRGYTVGTERALYQLCEGTCYAPDCDAPAIRFVESDPYSNLEIAHIHGAHPGSPRYDPDMSDDDRASFDNLLLLCKPHHELVDRRKPDEYPPETLRRWKDEREASSIGHVDALAGITDAQLEGLLEDVAARLSPARDVTVDLIAGALLPDIGEVLTGPFEGFQQVVDANAHLQLEPVLATIVRNVGRLAVTVQSVDVHVSVPLPRSEEPAMFTLHGRNDFPAVNPSLPARIADGGSGTWLLSPATIEMLVRDIDAVGHRPTGVHAKVSLATGETATSETVSVKTVRTAFPVRGET